MRWGRVEVLRRILELGFHVHVSDVVRRGLGCVQGLYGGVCAGFACWGMGGETLKLGVILQFVGWLMLILLQLTKVPDIQNLRVS